MRNNRKLHKSSTVMKRLKKIINALCSIVLSAIFLSVIVLLPACFEMPFDEFLKQTLWNTDFYISMINIVVIFAIVASCCYAPLLINRKVINQFLHSESIAFEELDNACLAIAKHKNGYEKQIVFIDTFYQSEKENLKISLEDLLYREKQLKGFLDFPENFYQILSAVVVSSILTICMNAYNSVTSKDSTIINTMSVSVILFIFICSIIFIIFIKYSPLLSFINLPRKKIIEYELSLLDTTINDYNNHAVGVEYKPEYYTQLAVLAQLYGAIKKAKGKQKKKLQQYMDAVKDLNLTDYDTSSSYRLGVIIAGQKCCLVCKKPAKTISKHRLVNSDYSTLYSIIKDSGISISTCKH